MPKAIKQQTDNITERIATLETRQDSMGDNIERLNRSQEDIQKSFTAAIEKNADATDKLEATLSDMRVTNEGVKKTIEGIQNEIKQHTGVINDITSRLTSIQLDAKNISNVEDRLKVFENKYEETLKRIFTEIETLKNRGKIDIVNLLAQFAVFLLGGSLAFIVAMFVYVKYLQDMVR